MTLTDCEESASCNTSSMQPTLEQESQALGLALREAVWQAQEQGRLHCGVMQCAQLLEIDPFNVMMCVIPVSVPDDVSGIIERTLIEAFCHEYQIRLIKVDSVNKLRKVLEGRAEGTDTPSESSLSTPNSSEEAAGQQLSLAVGLPPQGGAPNPAARVPAPRPPPSSGGSSAASSSPPLWELCSCVLVQYPESGEASEEEEAVAHHYKKTTSAANAMGTSLVAASYEEGCSVFVALPDD